MCLFSWANLQEESQRKGVQSLSTVVDLGQQRVHVKTPLLACWPLGSQNFTFYGTHRESLVEWCASEKHDMYLCRVCSYRDKKHKLPKKVTKRMISGTLLFLQFCSRSHIGYLLRKQNHIVVTDSFTVELCSTCRFQRPFRHV